MKELAQSLSGMQGQSLSPGALQRREGERLGEGAKRQPQGTFWTVKRKISFDNARAQRREETKPERLVWSHLNNRQMLNYKFRRQHVIGRFIVDFVCEELKLVIEIDGSHHCDQIDAQKTNHLEFLGYQIVRYSNHDILNGVENWLFDLEHQIRQKAGGNSPSPNLSPSRAGAPGERGYSGAE